MKQITEGDILDAAIKHVNEKHPDCIGDKPLQRLMKAKLVMAYMDSAEWMQGQLRPEWVPVSERLPDNSEPILVWQHNVDDVSCSRHQKAIFIKTFFKLYPHMRDSYYKLEDEFNGYDLEGDRCRITHWQPLPEPPTV